MSVSACPLKGPAVPQLQSNPHRSSFLRVQPGGLNAKVFASHATQLPPLVHNDQTHNNPAYPHYRKESPTIVNSYSLAPTVQHKPGSLSATSSNAPNVNGTTQLLFQSSSANLTDPMTESIPNGSNYRTMDYSTLPIPFNQAPSYMSREHSHDLKANTPLAYHDNRVDTDYMRMDFNPIVESLNFAANGTQNYDPGPNGSFGSWTANDPSSMDVDTDLKCRLDFRSQLLCNNNPISRLADDFRVAEQLYSNNTRRPPHGFNATTRGPSELDHFTVVGSRADPGSQCPPQFDVNAYPTVDARSQPSVGKPTSVSTVLIGTSGPGMTTVTCRGNPPPMMSPRSSAPCQPTSTQTLVVSASDNSMVSSAMMTPDSSTTGFMTNKFGGSSDDGEVSPTPTNSSGRPQTPGRVRKAAPTLATGRRNLKGELVDPDEADRRMKRRERNRKSAQKCRERKVQRTQELQAQVEYLQLEINRLTQERDSLRNEARQFVTLLQLHCPGVAIPYMSCLNEVPESLENNSLELTNSTIGKNGSELRAINVSAGWKSQANGKTCSVPDTQHSATVQSQNGSFSPLPPTVSLHSRMSPTRSKPSLTMGSSSVDQSDMTAGLNAIVTTAHQSNVDNSYRTSDAVSTPIVRCTSTASVQGPASSSSSSSCSAYELSFANLETPVRTPVLNGPYDDHPNRDVSHCSNADQSTSSTFQMPQSTVTSSSTPVPIPEGLEPTRIKCEEWDPCFMEPDKIDSISPISPRVQSKPVFINPLDTDISNGHCDLRRTESSTSNGPGTDGPCY